MPSPSFAALILTHGRPNNVKTLGTLRRCGYDGPVFLVVDDEDTTVDEYRQNFGADSVVVFPKSAYAGEGFDCYDNFPGRGTILFARNASWDIAAALGLEAFVQLDDDYDEFYWRYDGNNWPRYGLIRHTLGDVFDALVEFLENTSALTIALCQGGDLIGGAAGTTNKLKRKAMNSFVCLTNRPFRFVGRMNDDVNTYVTLGMRGGLFFTTVMAQLKQTQTQANPNGLSPLYSEQGTYVKSFYTVMAAPSCVQIGELGSTMWKTGGQYRIHHRIDWATTVPMILREEWRKPE